MSFYTGDHPYLEDEERYRKEQEQKQRDWDAAHSSSYSSSYGNYNSGSSNSGHRGYIEDDGPISRCYVNYGGNGGGGAVQPIDFGEALSLLMRIGARIFLALYWAVWCERFSRGKIGNFCYVVIAIVSFFWYKRGKSNKENKSDCWVFRLLPIFYEENNIMFVLEILVHILIIVLYAITGWGLAKAEYSVIPFIAYLIGYKKGKRNWD